MATPNRRRKQSRANPLAITGLIFIAAGVAVLLYAFGYLQLGSLSG